MKIKISFFLLCLSLLAGCQSKLDGSSEENFKASKLKIEAKLKSKEKEALEKALRVITLSAMSEKFNNEKYKDLSINEIALKKVHRQSYSDLLEMAETYLMAQNSKNIQETENEITELEMLQAKTKLLESKLNILEAKPIKMDLEDGELVLYATFTNKSDEYIDNYGTTIGYSSTRADNDGWACSMSFDGTEGIAPGESKTLSCDDTYASAIKRENAILWSGMQFPLTDFKKHNMVAKAYTNTLYLKGVKYELTGKEFNAENKAYLEDKIESLKAYRNTKGTLDELVLTDE